MQELTTITTVGRILQRRPNNKGIRVVSCEDPSITIMEIDEVSDSEVINVFLRVNGEIVPSLQAQEGDRDCIENMTHEILIDRNLKVN